jgi:hypothetical protein
LDKFLDEYVLFDGNKEISSDEMEGVWSFMSLADFKDAVATGNGLYEICEKFIHRYVCSRHNGENLACKLTTALIK